MTFREEILERLKTRNRQEGIFHELFLVSEFLIKKLVKLYADNFRSYSFTKKH